MPHVCTPINYVSWPPVPGPIPDVLVGAHCGVTAWMCPHDSSEKRYGEHHAQGPFKLGDHVRIERDETRWPSKGTWPRFRGRTGTVIMTNRDEYGVALGAVGYRTDGSLKSGNVAWFKSYEMRPLGP